MYLESIVAPETIRELLKFAGSTPPGAFVEVGVYKGGTASHLTQLAEEQQRDVFLYDTFEGIPYSSDKDWHKVGDFAEGVDYASIVEALPYAKISKGIFPASALPMGPIAFLHLDCDQYQSVIDSLAYLKDQLVEDAVVWFDDAPCQNWRIGHGRNGADVALRELFGEAPGVWQVGSSGKAYIRWTKEVRRLLD